MNAELGEKEVEALIFIESFIDVKGYPPTLREIANVIGYSVGGVQKIMKRLEDSGSIERDHGINRGIRVVQQKKKRNKK